ncbi:tissue factor pathway inhibitor [Drosophila kikkawai]|uniref:Tissue factor pathway inhibitor n=1 Tax=Drosophila kikkawai TaxID=30033 RepID=A0A6P4JEE7_DROKI|nr:kunitz-type serine protease inhibitor nigrescinin-1 [Drosophila kikkawai]
MYIFVSILLIVFPPLIAFSPQGFLIREPKCLYMANPGPCKNWVKVWGYDYMTNRCIFYFYGGCGGNPNRFYEKDECVRTCRVTREMIRYKRESLDEEQEEEEEFEEDIDNWDSFENWEP